MPHKAYARCVAALQNALAWQRTAQATAAPRHLATAETCLEIALEALRALPLGQLAAAEQAYLRALEARTAARADQARAAIRSSLEVLRDLEARPD